jgi:hypothetical protein
MRRLWIVLPVIALLCACAQKVSDAGSAPGQAEAAMAPAPAARQAVMATADSAAASDPSGPGRPAVTVPMLAYEYSLSLEVPLRRLPTLIDKHEKACNDAGPTVCQVIGAQTNAEGNAGARATLTVRAAPAWLKTFRARIQEDVKGAGGKVANTSVDTEDLTRAIIDTEAALRAKTTLRDRLQALLATRPGKLQELLEVERELARVQGEIDATQSELAVMRTRIATSKLTVSYISEGVLAPDNAMRPLSEAIHDVARNVAGGFAAIIVILSVLFPFAVVFGPVIWLISRWMRRRKAAKLAAAAGGTAAPELPKPAAPRPRGLRP